ncbi:MAG: UbiA family prenyltransferase [Patescibacteria group bacterium]|jgi:4-hydroxybenzoate polyprenyltransferase
MKPIIKALRLPVCFMAGALVLAAFRISNLSVSLTWLPSLATMLITSATMVWNDYCDRNHDAKKGKTTASEHSQLFLAFATAMWLIALVLVALALRQESRFSQPMIILIMVGLCYSAVRQIPLLPNLAVATAAALPALLPVFVGHTDPSLWILFASTFLAIHAREILKDFDDREHDPGYKWTLIQWLGEDRTKKIVICLLWLATLLVLGALILRGHRWFMFIVFWPAIHQLQESRDCHPKTISVTKLAMDLGIGLLLASLILPV